VTITEKTVSVKKEKVTMVGDMETRVVESSPTFSQTLIPITEVTEGDTVKYVAVLQKPLCWEKDHPGGFWGFYKFYCIWGFLGFFRLERFFGKNGRTWWVWGFYGFSVG